MTQRATFSQNARQEILKRHGLQRSFGDASLGVALLFAQKTQEGTIVLSPFNPEARTHLETSLQERLVKLRLPPCGKNGPLCFKLARLSEDAKKTLKKFFELGEDGLPVRVLPKLPPQDLRLLLAAFFVLTGSVSRPASSYHLSFSLPQDAAAHQLSDLMDRLAISSRFIERRGHCIVYVKDSQHIADLLLNVGAHQAMLTYESLRVEKDMRNQVNRVVNCDNANLARVANVGVRQILSIEKIDNLRGLGMLPEDLQEVARLRRQHPELSLQELGDLMSPKLGKSGVYHRLKKIESIAKSLEEGV